MMDLDSEDEELLLAIFILRRRIRRRLARKKKKRSVWIKEIFRQREQYGDYYTLIRNMKLADREKFFT